MSRYDTFNILVRDVKECEKCPRMEGSARVLNGSSGSVYSDLMFVGEAPGRRGADETEIPFHGDVSGNNFEELLDYVGLSRSDIFITNSVLCNPKDEKGNNSTPNRTEMENCSAFLERQIKVVDPKIVVTLGAVSLKALSSIEKHNFKLSENVRTMNAWNERHVIPLYHPGQRAMIHRSKANQRADYQFVAEQWRRLNKSRKEPSKRPVQEDILALCHNLLKAYGDISYFELHKLVYLTEYLYVRNFGSRLTKSYFIRQKDGPYCTDLQISRLEKSMPGLLVMKKNKELYLSIDSNFELPFDFTSSSAEELIQEAVVKVKERYSYSNNSDLKKIVYLTTPMRMILRRESKEHQNLFNAPIDFLVENTV